MQQKSSLLRLLRRQNFTRGLTYLPFLSDFFTDIAFWGHLLKHPRHISHFDFIHTGRPFSIFIAETGHIFAQRPQDMHLSFTLNVVFLPGSYNGYIKTVFNFGSAPFTTLKSPTSRFLIFNAASSIFSSSASSPFITASPEGTLNIGQ